MSTFVSVGNATQPFLRLLDAVSGIALQLPQPVIIQYGAAQGFVASHCQCVDYLSMEDFARHVAAAEVLILHAGAGSAIHAIRAGKVPVVVPRLAVHHEHVDDHQLEFASELERLGKIVVCGQMENLQEAVQVAVTLQKNGGAADSELPLLGELRVLLRQHALDHSGA